MCQLDVACIVNEAENGADRVLNVVHGDGMDGQALTAVLVHYQVGTTTARAAWTALLLFDKVSSWCHTAIHQPEPNNEQRSTHTEEVRSTTSQSVVISQPLSPCHTTYHPVSQLHSSTIGFPTRCNPRTIHRRIYSSVVLVEVCTRTSCAQSDIRS